MMRKRVCRVCGKIVLFENLGEPKIWSHIWQHGNQQHVNDNIAQKEFSFREQEGVVHNFEEGCSRAN